MMLFAWRAKIKWWKGRSVGNFLKLDKMIDHCVVIHSDLREVFPTVNLTSLRKYKVVFNFHSLLIIWFNKKCNKCTVFFIQIDICLCAVLTNILFHFRKLNIKEYKETQYWDIHHKNEARCFYYNYDAAAGNPGICVSPCHWGKFASRFSL